MRRLLVSLAAFVLIGCTGIPASSAVELGSDVGALEREEVDEQLEERVETSVDPAEPLDAGSLEGQEDKSVAKPEPPSNAGALEGEGEPLGKEEIPVLDNFGPAPELNNEIWLNTDRPLRLAELRGQVVLLEMWTFGCINCQHVIPSVRGWYEKYGPQGLVVIGNHYPEFAYEENLDNLNEAIQRLDVPYPVAQDNDGATWRAYNNRYWPRLYLIDKNGDIRYSHIGEGGYPETEAAIVALLAESFP